MTKNIQCNGEFNNSRFFLLTLNLALCHLVPLVDMHNIILFIAFARIAYKVRTLYLYLKSLNKQKRQMENRQVSMAERK